MGQELTCQSRWCFNAATVTCKCAGLNLCVSCLRTHMKEAPETLHQVVHLNVLNAPAEQVTYGKRIYHTPEGTTEIYEGHVPGRTEKVALKVQYCKTQQELNQRQEEAAVQRSIRHPNICKCYHSFLDPAYTSGYKHVIIMEFGSFGDVDQEVLRRKAENRYWSEGELMDLMFAITGALAHLEGLNIAHRDVKPCNILLCENLVPKLADFGLTVQGSDLLRTQNYQVVGTVQYLSPAVKQAYLDMWEGRNTTGDVKHNPFKSDVFSLGLTFYAVAALQAPTNMNSLADGLDVLQKRIWKRIERLRYTSKVKQILNLMLSVREDLRPHFSQVLDIMKTMEFTLMTEGEMDSESIDSEETKRTSEFPRKSEEQEMLVNLTKNKGKISRNVLDLVQRSLRSPEEIRTIAIEQEMTPDDIKPLCLLLVRNSLLERLELDQTNLGDIGANELATALSNSRNLHTLALGNNGIHLEGIKNLSKILPNLTNLTVLRLWRNHFQWEGALHLSLSLAHVPSLQELYLGSNEFGVEGTRYLSKALEKLTNMRILSLMDNAVKDEGVRHLVLALRRIQGIQKVYLDGNEIRSEGAVHLARTVPSWPALQTLSLKRNLLRQEDADGIRCVAGKAKVLI